LIELKNDSILDIQANMFLSKAMSRIKLLIESLNNYSMIKDLI